MTLIDKEEIIVGDSDTAKVLNSFFYNIDSNLNIAEYFNCEPHANNISDPVLKFAVRDIGTIQAAKVRNKQPRLPFSFSKIYLLTSLLQVLMILLKGLIFHPP